MYLEPKLLVYMSLETGTHKKKLGDEMLWINKKHKAAGKERKKRRGTAETYSFHNRFSALVTSGLKHNLQLQGQRTTFRKGMNRNSQGWRNQAAKPEFYNLPSSLRKHQFRVFNYWHVPTLFNMKYHTGFTIAIYFQTKSGKPASHRFLLPRDISIIIRVADLYFPFHVTNPCNDNYEAST